MSRQLTPFGRLFQTELNPLGHDLEDVFESFFNAPTTARQEGLSAFRAKMNVAETDKTYEVEVELPGVDENKIDVSMKDDILTISGERSFTDEKKEKNYHRMESSYGSFKRAVTLPGKVDESQVEANFEKGVLHITLPKVKEDNSVRKITVKSR